MIMAIMMQGALPSLVLQVCRIKQLNGVAECLTHIYPCVAINTRRHSEQFEEEVVMWVREEEVRFEYRE